MFFSLPNRADQQRAARTRRCHLERGVLCILTIKIVLKPLKKNVTQQLRSSYLQCVVTAQKD